jgi:hypothetical protein
MTNPLVLTEKKTGKGRTIHLHDDLLQFLDQVKAEIKPKPNALMFT